MDSNLLSSIQQSMYLTQKMYPESPMFNVGGYCIISAHLDENQISNALDKIIMNQEMLRTKFVEKDGVCYQQLCNTKTGIIKTLTLDQNELEKFAEQEMTKCLSLESPYLFYIIKCQTKTVVFMKMHHMLCDGYSISILVNQFKKAFEYPDYELIVGDTYSRYINEEKEYCKTERYIKDEKFWNEATSLPKEKAFESCGTSTIISNKVKRKSVIIKRDAFKNIESELKKYNSTIYHYIISNLYVLNHIYNNQDFYLGLPVLNRLGKNKNVLGPYIKVMPFGIDFDSCNTFIDVLNKTTAGIYNSYRHLKFPMNQIERNKNGLGYNVTFSYQRTSYPLDINNIPIDVRYMNPSEQQEDLTFHLLENKDTDEDVVFCVDYKVDMFEEKIISMLLERFQNLFLSLYKDISVEIKNIKPLKEEDERQILEKYNSTTCDFPSTSCVFDFIQKQIDKTPDNIAVRFRNDIITYKELDNKTLKIAKYLQANGIKNNTLVGICMERSIEMVVAIIATYRAGGAYVPIDPEYPIDRIKYMLEDSDAKVILSQSKFQELLSECNNVTYLDNKWDFINDEVLANDLISYKDSDNWAYMIYTSGSTGMPKGAVNKHKALVNRIVWMQKELGLTESDVVLQKTPFSFDVSVWEFVWPLMEGATLVMAEPSGHRKPVYLANLINETKVTTLHFVPSMLNIFVDNVDSKLCSSLKRIVCSGEELKVELMNKCLKKFNCDLFNLYGPTEAAIDVSCWKCSVNDDLRTVPIGKPIDNIQLYILNKDGHLLPHGVSGELCISGVGLAAGYYNKPELTASRFIENTISPKYCSRIYKTGDLARYNTKEEIEYLGRIDFQVKINGLRIELGEIEYQLEQINGINMAKVIDVQDEHGHKSLVAYLENSQEKEKLSPRKIKKILKENLPVYMVPTNYIYIDKLPLTPNGKLDRKSLGKIEVVENKEIAQPETDEQKILLELFKKVLGVDSLGIDDDFFEYGGTSLKGIELVSQYNKMEIDELFKYSTVRDITNYLNSKNKKNYGCIKVFKEDAKAAYNLICVPYGGGISTIYSDLAQNMSDEYNVYSVELAGHSYRKNSDLLSLDQMSMMVVSDIIKHLNNKPFIIYGHCVGSAMAFEIARKLDFIGKTVMAVFVAGTIPYESTSIERYISRIVSANMYKKNSYMNLFIKKIGGDTSELSDDQNNLMLKWFKHDGENALNYFETMRKRKYKVNNLFVITGEDDPLTKSKRNLSNWDKHAETVNYIEISEAKHYFIQDNPQKVAQIISENISALSQNMLLDAEKYEDAM